MQATFAMLPSSPQGIARLRPAGGRGRQIDATPDTARAARGSVSASAAGGKVVSTNRSFYVVVPLKHPDGRSRAKIWVLHSSGSPVDPEAYFAQYWPKLAEQPPPGPSSDFEYIKEQTRLPSEDLDAQLVVLRATDDLDGSHPVLLSLAGILAERLTPGGKRSLHASARSSCVRSSSRAGTPSNNSPASSTLRWCKAGTA